MKLIAHRGNLNGPNVNLENNPDYIQKALELGFDVEVDIWYDINDSCLKLGHDFPRYKVDLSFFENKQLWCHLKNEYAVKYFQENLSFTNWFWHQSDAMTLTSRGYLWTYKGTMLQNSVVLEMNNEAHILDSLSYMNFTGICSDNVIRLKHKINEIGLGWMLENNC